MRALSIFALFFFTSCFRDIHSVKLTQEVADGGSYSIKSVIAGCCGCESVYYNLISHKIIREQLYEYACHNGQPTKFVFNYDSNSRLVSLDTLLAVSDDSFTHPLTNFEISVLNQMDSIANMRPEYSRNTWFLRDVTGFRKFRVGEHPHPFPYNRKEKPIYKL